MIGEPHFRGAPYRHTSGSQIYCASPPFAFRNVVARVFPLRADPYVLTQLCNDYVNVMPQEVAGGSSWFQPVAPLVFLVQLNYGRMSSETADVGWVSQNEIGFMVPVKWYVRRHLLK